MKWFIFLFAFSIPSQLLACECVAVSFENNYRRSDFIATAKIVSISDVEQNSNYQEIKIEIIELYKGSHISSIMVESNQKSLCGIFTPKNTNWLIFASYNSVGILSFGLCSGSMQINNISSDPKYPNYGKNEEAKIKHTLNILAYLKKMKLVNLNEYELGININTNCIKELKGYRVKKQRFAIYEISISKKLVITKVKNIKAFDNNVLSKKLLACIKKNAIVNTSKLKEIPFNTKVVVIYFFTPSDQNYPSFLSKVIY